jgi:N-acetylmuramoyl-L-alanine amidase
LVETGFLTNSVDRVSLKSNEGQQKIALGIFRAVRDYKNSLEALNSVNGK